MQDIETIAVTSVEKRLSYIDYIETGLRKKDKEPLWDGNIYLYSTKDRSTKELVRHIICQCKGKIQQEPFKTNITFSVPKNEMKSYLDNGGVMYFVVY